MFPIQRQTKYSLGELRRFELELSAKRIHDKCFSDELRLNNFPWAKLRNEELVPFELLMNWFEIPDKFQFSISKEGFAGADISLHGPTGDLSFQITTAAPNWNQDGGRTNRYENESIKNSGIAWGAGGTLKKGSKGKLISSPRTVEPYDRQSACRNGITQSLENKLCKKISADCLIVYARSFSPELIDEGFKEFLQPITTEITKKFCDVNLNFPVFVVDNLSGGPFVFGVNAVEIVNRFMAQ
jgi:hypothetical protein